MPVPDDNRAWAARNQILDRVTDKRYPVSAEQQNETTPK